MARIQRPVMEGDKGREKKKCIFRNRKKKSESIRKWKGEKRGREGLVNYSSVRGHHSENRDVMLALLQIDVH